MQCNCFYLTHMPSSNIYINNGIFQKVSVIKLEVSQKKAIQLERNNDHVYWKWPRSNEDILSMALSLIRIIPFSFLFTILSNAPLTRSIVVSICVCIDRTDFPAPIIYNFTSKSSWPIKNSTELLLMVLLWIGYETITSPKTLPWIINVVVLVFFFFVCENIHVKCWNSTLLIMLNIQNK